MNPEAASDGPGRFRHARVDPVVRDWLGAAQVRTDRFAKKASLGIEDLTQALDSAEDPWAGAWRAATGQEDPAGDEPDRAARHAGVDESEPSIRGMDRAGAAPGIDDLDVLAVRPDLEELLDGATDLGDGHLLPWSVILLLLGDQGATKGGPDPEAAGRFLVTPLDIRFGENQVVEIRREVGPPWWGELDPDHPARLVLLAEAEPPLPEEVAFIRPTTVEPCHWAEERFRSFPVLWVEEEATPDDIRSAAGDAGGPIGQAHPGGAPPWICPVTSGGLEPERLRTLLDGLAFVHRLRLIVSSPGDVVDDLPDHLSDIDSPEPTAVALSHLTARSRVAEAQPAISDRPVGTDQLGTTPTAQALAWTIALRETDTPLCIGLFGPWGAGKSFLMRQVATQLSERGTEMPASLKGRFVDRVRLVHFNAWTYAKGDLWSALLFEILSSLRAARDLPQAERLERVVEARRKLAAKREELARERDDLAQRESNAERQRTASETFERFCRNRVDLLMRGVDEERRNLESAGRRALLAGARTLLPWVDEPAERRWGLSLVALLGIGVLAAVGALWHGGVLDVLVEQVLAVVTALGSALAALTAPVRRALAETRDARQAHRGAREKLHEQLTTLEEQWQSLEQEVEVREGEHLREARKAVVELEKEVRGAERTLHDALDRYGTPVAGRDLGEFLDARLEEGDYLERLGPLQRVEQDLKELAVILASSQEEGEEREGEGEPPLAESRNRIVLMIDDLDRCPPDKLVVVLEAIQLLLAENSYLSTRTGWPFVVVLAADTRVLTRALEKEYEGILSPYEGPSGLDYLEKVIQIPYRVPAVSDDRYTAYLEKLTDHVLPGADDGAGDPTEQGEPSPDRESEAEPAVPALPPIRWELGDGQPLMTPRDLGILAEQRPFAPKHPRGIKRVLNLYRLAKVLGMKTGRFEARETAFLLNLAGGFPETARELVRRLQDRDLPDGERVLDLLEEIRGASGQPTSGTGAGRGRSLEAELEVLFPRLAKGATPAEPADPRSLQAVLPDIAPFCFVTDLAERS